MFGVPPAVHFCGEECRSNMAESSTSFARGGSGRPGGKRVHTFGEHRTKFGGLLTRSRESHSLSRTQSGLALHTLAVSLAFPQEHPAFRPGSVDPEIQTAAIGMAPRFRRDGAGRQPVDFLNQRLCSAERVSPTLV
jgi:hypothetical protein